MLNFAQWLIEEEGESAVKTRGGIQRTLDGFQSSTIKSKRLGRDATGYAYTASDEAQDNVAGRGAYYNWAYKQVKSYSEYLRQLAHRSVSHVDNLMSDEQWEVYENLQNSCVAFLAFCSAAQMKWNWSGSDWEEDAHKQNQQKKQSLARMAKDLEKASDDLSKAEEAASDEDVELPNAVGRIIKFLKTAIGRSSVIWKNADAESHEKHFHTEPVERSVRTRKPGEDWTSQKTIQEPSPGAKSLDKYSKFNPHG